MCNKSNVKQATLDKNEWCIPQHHGQSRLANNHKNRELVICANCLSSNKHHIDWEKALAMLRQIYTKLKRMN